MSSTDDLPPALPAMWRALVRGYRALTSVPRLPRLVAQKVVNQFGDLATMMAASDAELAAVEGVGEGRAKEIREGLRSLQEVDIVDRYA